MKTRILVSALVLLLALMVPVMAQTTQWDRVAIKQLIVLNTANLRGAVTADADLSVGDDLAVTDAVTAASVTTTDDVTIGGDGLLTGALATDATTVEVTAGGEISPVGSSMVITSAASLGTRLVVTTTVPDGSWLSLQNGGSFTITLTDTVPLILSGNAVLGPDDTLLMRLHSGQWYEYGGSNN